jgi:hypothetical protein
MSLPFGQEEPGKGQRKYQCFVCGRQYLEFDEYKLHITESHDEGRDYVICPLGRCGAPVRDVKLHFKTKHPSEIMPQKGMMKAMVWRDFKDGKCQKVKGPKNRRGYHDSTKMQKQFFFRSGWEKEVYEYLDAEPDVLGYKAEPFEIVYVWKGEQHKYTPDIYVYFVDGRTQLWEVKPANQTLLEQNQCKWGAAETQCSLRGWKFCVITEVEMGKFKKRKEYLEHQNYNF